MEFKARLFNTKDNTDNEKIPINLDIYWDDNWDMVFEEPDCLNRRRLSR